MMQRISTSTSTRLTRPSTTIITAIALMLLTLLSAWPALAGPVVTSVSPNYSGSSINAGTFMSNISVGGTGFCPGVRVQLYQNGAYVGSSFPAAYSSATSLTRVSINFPGPAGNYFIGAIDDLGNCGGSQVNPTTALMVRPIITSLSPSSVQAGSATFTLTINGAGFGPGSVIQWNGTVLPATYVSPTQLTAQIPSSYLTNGQAVSIYASDPSGTIFNTSGFSFSVQRQAPTISSISTISGNGTPTTGIRVFGTNFLSGSYVTGNSYNLGSVFPTNGGTQFDAYLATSGEIVNGTSTICVTNSSPGGGTACAGYAYDSTKFVLSSISPTVTTAGTGITLTANGANFPSNATIRWNGADLTTTYVSSTQLTASISSGLVGTAGTATITVYNPNTSAASNALTFTINNQTPTITSLTTTMSPVGQGFTLYINGTGFVSGSAVSFDNDNIGPLVTYYGPTQLYMYYNPSYSTGIDLLRTPGPHNITVTNYSYNGGTSNAATLTLVHPTPTLSSISPTTAPMDSGFVLTATGSSFDTDSIIQWNGTNLQTDYSSSTSLVAWVPLTDVQNGGTATITVYNPGPGGGTSGSKSLTISYPVPTLSSSDPPTIPMGSSSATITLTGSRFFDVSTVQWNGEALTATYVDPTHLSVSVPSSKLSSPGTATITVTNPSPGGGASNSFTFVVTPVLQVGALTQSGWNVASTVTWPSSSGISNQSVDCGTTPSQVLTGPSVTCIYSKAGTSTIAGASTVGTVNNVRTPTQSITVPTLTPSAGALTATIDGRPAKPNADTYSFPVPLGVAIALTRPSGVGIVDPLDLDDSTLQIQLNDTAPTTAPIAAVDSLNYTATRALSQAGTYAITFSGKTASGTSLNASTTATLTLNSVSLQVGALAQNGWNVNAPISWPDGVDAIQIDCGTSPTQTFAGNSGECVYNKAGAFSVTGRYREPYHGAQVTTPPATVTVPRLAPSAAALSIAVNGLQPTVDGSVAPFHFPATLDAAITMTRPDGVGVVDPLDPAASRLTVTPSGGTPLSTYVRPGDDALHASASSSLSGPDNYTVQLNARTQGGSPVTASLSLQVRSGAPPLTVGAISQDGFDALVPVSWPADLNGATPVSINCGTSNAQLITDTSGTCRYTTAKTFQVTGAYRSPETGSPTLLTAPQSVTVPLRVPTGATLASTVNNQPIGDNSVTAHRFPAVLNAAITLTLPPDIGIVDPLDTGATTLRVQRAGATTVGYRLRDGADPTQTTGTASLDAPGDYTITLAGRTVSGHSLTITQPLAVASANVTPVVGALAQDGPNVTVAVSWPDAISPVSIDCGTSSSQAFTGQSGQCTYNRSGQFQITGRYIDPEDNQPIAAAPATVTVPSLTPVNSQITLQVNSQPVTDTAPTYRLPSILQATVTMQRPDGIGVLERIDTDNSSILIVPDSLPSAKYRPSVKTDPLIVTASGDLRYAGHYTIQFAGKTTGGQQITASAPLEVALVTASLQADPPVQDGEAVAVRVQWPDGGPTGIIQCGFMSQRLTATGGVCRYTRAGTYQIIGYFTDAARGATVATEPVNVVVPQIEPITPTLTIQTVNSPGFSADTTGPVPAFTTQQPASYPVQVQLVFSLQRPDGMGILDSLDLGHSTLTATAVKEDAQPIRIAMRPGPDRLTYTATASLSDFAAETDNPAQWRYRFTLAGQSFGGTSYAADAELVGPIGAAPFTLQVRRGAPQIPYAPATYTYTLNGVSSPTKREPFTPVWTISADGQTLQTMQKDRIRVTFDQPGTYQIQLAVTGPFSQPTSWSDTVVVPTLPDAPAATITASTPRYNRPPAQYRFRATIPPLPDRRERVGAPTWTIDDTVSTAPSAVTTFTTPGDHQVSVNIPTSYGRTIAGTATVTVNPNQPPTGTVDCAKSYYSISRQKYLLLCRATAADPDGRVRHLVWRIPELSYERAGVTAIGLEQTEPQAVTVELHITDDSDAETVVTTPIDMASLPRK